MRVSLNPVKIPGKIAFMLLSISSYLHTKHQHNQFSSFMSNRKKYSSIQIFPLINVINGKICKFVARFANCFQANITQ